MPIQTMDEFLKHKTSERSGGFIHNWKKKNNPPKINTWMHTLRLPVALWQHGFMRIVEREDPQTRRKTLVVWGDTFNCREDESILVKQYHRNDDGERRHPPVACGACRFLEYIRTLVEEGELGWTDPLFRFEGTTDVRVIHTGGFYGAYRGDDLQDEELAQIRAAGINLKEAWMENGMSKCNYLMQVVDNANPAGGVQTAIEAAILGDKIKEVINNTMISLEGDRGNPCLYPYAIQWEHLPAEPEFNKRYTARRMELIPLTPSIEKLIREPPPDVSGVMTPLNNKPLRGLYEKHCLIKDIDWDYVFDIDESKGVQEQVPAFPPADAPAPRALPPSRVPEINTRSTEPAPAQEAADVDSDLCPVCKKTEEQGCPHVACDKCDKPILATDDICAHCGHVYRTPAPPPQTPRKRRTRAEVAKG